MQIPNIDLTDAARSYGLSYVPPIKQATLFDYLIEGGDPKAGFDQNAKDITVFASLFQPPTEYDEKRFLMAGAGRLQYPDSAKFVLAHELWHARQAELDPEGLRYGDNSLEQHSAADHDANVYERSADVHAAKVYSQIKIGD